MGNSKEEDYSLVAKAMAGDYDAFGQLYSQYLDRIYRYTFFRVGDQCDAEDLTEQVFLKAWEALPGYRQYGIKFSSWLYRIAHNMVIDHHRRKKNAKPVAFEEGQGWDKKLSYDLEQVIQADEAAALAEAIAKLPEEYQQVVLLRFVEGLKHSEVAQILNKSEGACRAIQYQALSSLNQLLAGLRENE